MRCKEVGEFLESGTERTPAVREHLKKCSACARLAQSWEVLRYGFAALAAEPAPEPSWGFTERLMRRLAAFTEQSQRGQEFLERAGRRVFYATLLVTLMALLGLALPSSGPLRAPSHPTVLFAQPDFTADYQEPILGATSVDQVQPEPVNSTTSGSEGGQPQK
jgi:anti-sigma factor RsiW